MALANGGWVLVSGLAVAPHTRAHSARLTRVLCVGVVINCRPRADAFEVMFEGPGGSSVQTFASRHLTPFSPSSMSAPSEAQAAEDAAMVEALKVKVEALAQSALDDFIRVTRLNDLAKARRKTFQAEQKFKRKTTIRSPKKGRQAASKAHAKRGKAPAEPLRTEELESCSLEAEESTKRLYLVIHSLCFGGNPARLAEARAPARAAADTLVLRLVDAIAAEARSDANASAGIWDKGVVATRGLEESPAGAKRWAACS